MSAVLLVYEQIFEHLLTNVRNGNVKPGDKLIPEEAAAKKFNVSRGTVRKAYQQMVELGYIMRKRGSGTVVVDDIFEKISKTKLHFSNDLKTIGVVLSEEDDFLIPIIKVLEESIIANGWKMELMFNSNVEKERYCIDSLIRNKADGIIIIPLRRKNIFSYANYYRLLESKKPFVMIGKPVEGIRCNAVYADDLYGSFQIVEILRNKGCTEIVHVTDTRGESMVVSERIKGYQIGISQCNLKYQQVFDVADPSFKEKFKKYLEFNKEIIGINFHCDEIFMSVYQIILDSKRNIDKDIFMIGVNANPITKNTGIKYLSMEIPKAKIAKTAVELLTSCINKDTPDRMSHIVFNQTLYFGSM